MITLNININADERLLQVLEVFSGALVGTNSSKEKIVAQSFREDEKSQETTTDGKGKAMVSKVDDNPTEEDSLYTLEVVRATLGKYLNKNGKVAAKEILTKFGAKSLTDLDEKYYGEVMELAGGL